MQQAQNVEVLLHANVMRLATNADATHVERVEFSTLAGKTGVVVARYVVLACGGLENPRLLLNSDDVLPFGLGNRRGMVGRYFMEHPSANVGKLYLDDSRAATSLSFFSDTIPDPSEPIGAWRPALCLGEAFEQQHSVGGGYYRFMTTDEDSWQEARFRFTNAATPLRDRVRISARFFDEWAYATYRLVSGYTPSFTRFSRNEAIVFIEFEQLPNWDSRVSLTEDRDRFGLRRLALDWQLTEQEVLTARALGNAIGQQAHLQGWGRFQFEDWLLGDGIDRFERFGFACHHMGTTRMAHDSQFGVVDPECLLFDCDNVYVAGSSVFPSASFVNPTLTIVALAFRISDTLKKRLA
jgi:choline dehydrogenase-like flavoprotein